MSHATFIMLPSWLFKPWWFYRKDKFSLVTLLKLVFCTSAMWLTTIKQDVLITCTLMLNIILKIRHTESRQSNRTQKLGVCEIQTDLWWWVCERCWPQWACSGQSPYRETWPDPAHSEDSPTALQSGRHTLDRTRHLRRSQGDKTQDQYGKNKQCCYSFQISNRFNFITCISFYKVDVNGKTVSLGQSRRLVCAMYVINTGDSPKYNNATQIFHSEKWIWL